MLFNILINSQIYIYNLKDLIKKNLLYIADLITSSQIYVYNSNDQVEKNLLHIDIIL